MARIHGLAEFSLAGKVVIVSGAARGLGLTQVEALLEAGARGMYIWALPPPLYSLLQLLRTCALVYALDRLPEPSPDFHGIAEKAKGLGTCLEYRQIDVREVDALHNVVQDIADKEGRLDGLIAAAGIQQETPALEYKAEDANRMFEVNITGVFMTAQAVAKQMIRFGNGGSMVLIASMSGSVANRVHAPPTPFPHHSSRYVGDANRSNRVSSAQHTTHPRPRSSSSVEILPRSGASITSG